MAQKVALTNEQLQEFKQMADEGVAKGQVAKHFGICYETVHRIAEENNIEFKTVKKLKKRILTEEQLQEFKRMADAGNTKMEIGTHFGFSLEVVGRIAKENKIVFQSGMPFQRRVLTDEQMEVFKQMADEGETIKAISNRLNLTRDIVYRIIKQFNIKIKPTPKNSRRKGYNWTDEKIQKLKEMYDSPDIKFRDIVLCFKCAPATISNKARQLGLVKRRAYEKLFTEEEIEYLKKNIGLKSMNEICLHLNRCDETIEKKISELGLINSYRFWASGIKSQMPDSDEFYNDIGNPSLSHAFLGRKYNVNGGTVSKWRQKLFGSFKVMRDTYLCKSTAEMDFEDILDEMSLAYIYQQKVNKWKVDYNLGFKTLVEIQGSYWHTRSQKNIERDKRKLIELTDAGYTVLVIWEDELQNKSDIKQKVLVSLYNNIQLYYGSLNLVNSKIEVSA